MLILDNSTIFRSFWTVLCSIIIYMHMGQTGRPIPGSTGDCLLLSCAVLRSSSSGACPMFLDGDFHSLLFACILNFVYGHDAQALCVIVIVIEMEYFVWSILLCFLQSILICFFLHLHKLLKSTLSRCNPTRFAADNQQSLLHPCFQQRVAKGFE